jgi:hypothetical protein
MRVLTCSVIASPVPKTSTITHVTDGARDASTEVFRDASRRSSPSVTVKRAPGCPPA